MANAVKVRYSRGPSWDVGQGTEEARPGEHYPGDYLGRVVAVLPADDESDPGQAADFFVEPTDEQLVDLRARKLKVMYGDRLAPVTFEDRYGACASNLLKRFPNATVNTADEEKAAIDEVRDANDLARKMYRGALGVWIEDYNAAFIAQEILPERPEPPRLEKEPEPIFGLEAARLRRRLPANAAQTGTGLYSTTAVPTKNDDTQSGAAVDHGGSFTITLTAGGLGTAAAFAGGYVTNVTEGETAAIISHIDDEVTLEEHAGITIGNWGDGDDLDIYNSWSTIQGALDQLWTDQGAAAFTAHQYIRVFAGTFAEKVTPQAGLLADDTAGYTLIMEGDPDDLRANVIVQPGVETDAFYINCDYSVVRHMTIDGTNATVAALRADTGAIRTDVLDCDLTMTAATRYAINIKYNSYVADCVVTSAANGIIGATAGGEFTVKRTTVTKTGAQDGVGVYAYVSLVMESCVVDGFADGVRNLRPYRGSIDIRHCTFYSCDTGLNLVDSIQSPLTVINNIFDNCDYVFTFTSWPDEATEGEYGPRLFMRNNIWQTNTAFAYDGAATKSYAQIGAMDLVDAAGDLNEIDPQMTDPASNDYSLEADSPCRKSGHGSGVPTDYLGIAFDANNPDIGAWSGTSTITSPTWPSTLPQVLDQAQFSESLSPVTTRSEMDTGPAKVRRRFTSGIQPIAGSIVVTIAQAATLDTFFTTTLQGGSLSFQWTHPRTGAAAEMRFLGPPVLTHRGPGHFTASLGLEILP